MKPSEKIEKIVNEVQHNISSDPTIRAIIQYLDEEYEKSKALPLTISSHEQI